MAELVNGFELLSKMSNGITVFGTQSIPVGSPYYEMGYQIGKTLAENQFSTITGGGPGVQEAINKGAFEHGGESIGLTIRINDKERINQYLTKSMGFFFPFVRKLVLTAPSKTFVCMPGGFGTLHQLFELLTLQETRKVAPVPIIVYHQEFWNPLLDFVRDLYSKFQTISLSDEDLIKTANSTDDILYHIANS